MAVQVALLCEGPDFLEIYIKISATLSNHSSNVGQNVFDHMLFIILNLLYKNESFLNY